MAKDERLEDEGLDITILTNKRINPDLVLIIEKESFVNEPSETLEGIEILLQHGTILAIDGKYTKAIAESITLQKLLGLDLVKLPSKSPLKMIWENERRGKVLSSVQEDYPGMNNYHYAHGIAVSEKEQGYGTRLFIERLKMLVENDLMFGFVMASPPNIPSIRMYLRQRAMIDNVEHNVYEDGKTYFRMVYCRNFYSGKVVGKVELHDKDMQDIKLLLAKGYVGVNFEAPNSLLFAKRL